MGQEKKLKNPLLKHNISRYQKNNSNKDIQHCNCKCLKFWKKSHPQNGDIVSRSSISSETELEPRHLNMDRKGCE